jgi:diadenosine tetraphosphate (Ap4A) HIT family hydrolase
MAKKNCALCSGEGEVIYEDDEFKAIMAEDPAVVGQIQLFPKEHFTIFEQVPDFTVGKLFSIANKLSTASFEALGMQGTNIIVTNGVAAGQKHAHFSVSILPRGENDGVNLEWQPQQLSEEEMSSIELKIKDHTEEIGKVDATKEVKTVTTGKKGAKKEKVSQAENYLLRSLNRIP